MKEITYLIYIILWEGLLFLGTGYAVFVLGKSGWWFVLAIYLSGAAYSPYRWGIEGAKPARIDIENLKKVSENDC